MPLVFQITNKVADLLIEATQGHEVMNCELIFLFSPDFAMTGARAVVLSEVNSKLEKHNLLLLSPDTSIIYHPFIKISITLYHVF
jgi:hypothetical protein